MKFNGSSSAEFIAIAFQCKVNGKRRKAMERKGKESRLTRRITLSLVQALTEHFNLNGREEKEERRKVRGKEREREAGGASL